ncbi:hypothetical protein [Coxiella burnetii]|uniref:hypothetical protein n=1 Tax=Coxiella burnetii TaxID=777 RepID=UPI000183D132|nr:hypothetical protein [Coxiella burnetii]ACJ19095.1 hypothetical exported protein [Coxiella burnetii CbuG_Q212]ATN67440.1 hypothetical protein AYM17_09020 [Coxiella burnetii]OYK85627.1 hypothetical protein CbuQ229_09355 [Coxiella burnetii]
MIKRLIALSITLFLPLLGVANTDNALQRLVVTVENTTNKTLTYRNIYEPAGTIKKIEVEHTVLLPGQRSRILIFSDGTGLIASINFTDNDANELLFEFNDPAQYYQGGYTDFKTTAQHLATSTTQVHNPAKPSAKLLLWTEINYQVSNA